MFNVKPLSKKGRIEMYKMMTQNGFKGSCE